MTFNEFNKEVNKRIPDPNLRFLLTMLYEMIRHVGKQGDEQATVILNVVEQMQKIAIFGGDLDKQIKRLERRGQPDGVEVESVANDPEKEIKQ